jgi:thiamine kinase-like enzyme
MMVQYKPNGPDQAILGEISNRIRASLTEWYGRGARLNSAAPEIRTYQSCFMLRYPVSVSQARQTAILVKIRRHPKMDSLHQAIQSDIHQTMIQEYQTLVFLYDRLGNAGDDFGAIRPLLFFEKYFAILMEEYPSRTMRQLMETQRSAKTGWEASALQDAARKTGRWLHYFHHQINTAFDNQYNSRNILVELQPYAEKIETCSQGRVRARPILDAFAGKLQSLAIERVRFSQCHLDMTTNNVLYAEDGRVCIIDMKNRLAPVYADLGLILTYPETSKPQIISGGRYYSEGLLHKYRTEIIAGYFDREPGDEVLVRVYSALKVVDKWSMYEELMARYKGLKRAVSVPAAPLVSLYFQNLLKKHLELIETGQPGQALKLDKTRAGTSL